MDKYTFKANEEIVLFSKEQGFIRAWAAEDHNMSPGSLAIFPVRVNSASFPGISEMTINTNHFDVFHLDDPEMLKKVLDKFVPYEFVR